MSFVLTMSDRRQVLTNRQIFVNNNSPTKQLRHIIYNGTGLPPQLLVRSCKTSFDRRFIQHPCFLIFACNIRHMKAGSTLSYMIFLEMITNQQTHLRIVPVQVYMLLVNFLEN